MARWGDIAPWQGPAADNFGDGDWAERETADRMPEHRGLVIHIAEGSYAGTVAWERNAGSDISSHWVLAKDGRCAQMVDTDDRPWTQGAGNDAWLSVECEGYAGDSLTAQQVEVVARLLARAHREYGVPLQLADSPSGRGLGWHGMGGAAWGGHTGCPGAPIVAQRPAIIARAAQIINGGDDEMTTVAGEELGSYLARIERALWWQIPGISSTVAELKVSAAEERTRDAGLRAAVDALAAALKAGTTGTPLDTVAVLARVDQRAAEVRQLVEQQHAQELAGLQAQLAALAAPAT